MTGYTINPGEKLTGNVNSSHVMLNLRPCSLPCPSGDGTNAPTWSNRHHDTPTSAADVEAYRNKTRAQAARSERRKARRVERNG